jgi:hypothetical protein
MESGGTMSTMFTAAAALLMSAALVACDPVSRDPAMPLKVCLASTEQIVLLRKMALSEKAKDDFDYCVGQGGEMFCRALYLDANGAVRQCMNAQGFIFVDDDYYLSRDESPYTSGNKNLWLGGVHKNGICEWKQYQKPDCYHDKLPFKLANPWSFKPSDYQP